MPRAPTRVDTLAALDAAGVILWGRQFAGEAKANGWYWAHRWAVRRPCQTGAGKRHKGVHGPFPTIFHAARHAVRWLNIRVAGYAPEPVEGVA